MPSYRPGILLSRALSDCSDIETRRNSREDKFDEFGAMGGYRELRHTIGE